MVGFEEWDTFRKKPHFWIVCPGADTGKGNVDGR